MKYVFYGEPNMLVKTRKRVPFEGTFCFKPLFRFDSNGEYVTEDERLIEKLKSRFDHRPITDVPELIESYLKEEVEELPSEEIKSDLKAFKCKHCEFETDSKGELLAHYRKHKGGK